jgi:phosphoribosylformylglycinamidine cyclo-ligase
LSEGPGLTYAGSGVDTVVYERLLGRVKPLIAATHGDAVATGVGAFAGLFELPGGGGFLAASADGVGTKTKVAAAFGRHRGIGHDLVNHCVNDIATSGATPLFLLDYFACGRLEPGVFEPVMAGLAEACAANGCALLGGETAEMPGMYGPGDYDLAGFIVGHIPAGATAREPVQTGDLLIGLPSSGLHTNGYSLVRRVFEDVSLDHVYADLGRPLGEVLLEPHRAYLQELSSLPWKAAAHITGGGLLGNVPRALPDHLGAKLDCSTWTPPPIFDLIQRLGRVGEVEMLSTFNMGLGMVLVASEPLPGHPIVGRVFDRGAGPRVSVD